MTKKKSDGLHWKLHRGVGGSYKVRLVSDWCVFTTKHTNHCSAIFSMMGSADIIAIN